MYRQLFPILSTTDVQRALRFYRDLLGGTVAFEYPGPDGQPAYVGIDLGESHLGIGQDPAAPGPDDPKAMSLWIYADDCDAATEALRAGGVTITAEPADQPWGERMARVLDFDGNEVIVATAPLDPDQRREVSRAAETGTAARSAPRSRLLRRSAWLGSRGAWPG